MPSLPESAQFVLGDSRALESVVDLIQDLADGVGQDRTLELVSLVEVERR
jgi:hypothetical protein